MIENLKSSKAYKTIGEVAKELDLINEKTGQIYFQAGTEITEDHINFLTGLQRGKP